MNNRRSLIIALGAAAIVRPVGAFAQRLMQVRRIGVLIPGSVSGWGPMVEALKSGLRDLGYVEGKDINLEYRYADGQYERLASLANELVRTNVDLIVTNATAGVGAARQATTTIPIVIAAIGDPVASGFVTNLSRPGSNLTGLTFFAKEIAVKRLEILKEAMPGMRHAAFIKDSSIPQPYSTAMENAAQAMKIALELVDLGSKDNLEGLVAEMAKKRIGGIVVMETPTLISIGATLGAAASKNRIASIGFKEVVQGGGLIAYGANLAEMWRRAASYVDKILKGAAPGDLPIEQATKFELVVNKKAGSALGIKFPESILLRADRVIE